MKSDLIPRAVASSHTTNNTAVVHHLEEEPPPHSAQHEHSRTLDEVLQDSVALSASVSCSQMIYQWRYWLFFFSLGVANSSDAAEILCISYILADDHFQQHMLSGNEGAAGLLAAAVFCGMLLGGLLMGGSLGDLYWGRRKALLAGLALNSIAGFLSAVWSPDVYVLALLRFVAGVGIGATIPPLFTLCSELAPPSLRGFAVTIAASFWMVGSIYVAVVAWWWFEGREMASWRVFAALCAVPSAFGWLLVFAHLPESPRYLLIQGDYSRALAVIHDIQDRSQYLGPQWTMEELQQHAPPVAPRRTLVFRWSKLVQDFWGSASQLYVPQLRQTTWPLQLIWFSLSFGSYGLYTWINTLFVAVHLDNVYFNALLFALSNLPGNVFSAIFMDRVGRTKLLVGSIIAAALSLISFAYVAFRDGRSDTQDQEPGLIVLSACCFQCFTIVSWNAIDVLTSEMFPTTVRATGMGMCAASGRVGAMLAQLVNGSLVNNPVALLLVAASSLLFGALSPTLLPHDMTGQSISDVVEAGEGYHSQFSMDTDGPSHELSPQSGNGYQSIQPDDA